MSEKCSANSCAILQIVKRQFLSGLDQKVINWEGLFLHLSSLNYELSESHLEELLNQSVLCCLNLKYPVRKPYQLAFLKTCISQAEKYNLEFSKGYELFVELLDNRNQSEAASYKHYFIGEKVITLKESDSFISSGTTGLCTWEAGIALANWCFSKPELLSCKRVLELGSGTGLTGLALLSSATNLPVEYLFTDCHLLVLRQLEENLAINRGGTDSSTKVDVRGFDWRDESTPQDFLKADLVLGADIVYDPELIEVLCDALKRILNSPEKLAVIACTVRNPDTINLFIQSLGLLVLFDNNLYIGEMSKKVGGNEKEVKRELLVFGYACKLFRDDERAQIIDSEAHLIPWMGDDSLKIDRYDGRGALYDLSSHEPTPGAWDCLSVEERHMEAACDQERYRSLYINEVEELTYKEEDVKRQQEDYGQIAYDYGGVAGEESKAVEIAEPADLSEAVTSKPFVAPPDMALPSDMATPHTMKHSAIIERTALFIAQQGSQMEILMKLKQHGNKNFDFLSHNDPLHEFYKHVLTLIKNGSYVPTQEQILDENPTDVSVEEDSDEHYLHPSLVTKVSPLMKAPPPPTTAPSAEKTKQIENEPSEFVQKVINKMVDYVVRIGPAFEREIMRKDDVRFSFIKSSDQHYPFYRKMLIRKQRIFNEELQMKLHKQNELDEKKGVPMEESKDGKKKPLPVNFSIKKPKEKKGLEVPSALPVEESSEEEETGEVKSPKPAASSSSLPKVPPPTPPPPPKISPSDLESLALSPHRKRLKKSSSSRSSGKSRKVSKDDALKIERKLKVAQFLKELKKKS